MSDLTYDFVAFVVRLGLMVLAATGALLSLLASTQMVRRMRFDPSSAYAESEYRFRVSRRRLIASYFSQYGLDWNSACLVGGMLVAVLGMILASRF